MDETEKPKVFEWIEEWDKLKIPVEVPPIRTYDTRLVAFIDVLGIRNLASDSSDKAEEILTTMGSIQKYVSYEFDKLVGDRKLDYLQIGDGFLIATKYLELVNQICEMLSKVQWLTLVYSQKLIRGALTAGKAVVNEDGKFFIGPAIIEVFKLEKENAIFPRIIFLNEIETLLPKGSIKFNYVVEDQDTIKYLDFIKYNVEREQLSNKRLDELLTTEGVKNMVKNEYEKLMFDSSSDDKKTAQKYGWLITKLEPYGIRIL